MSAPHLLVICLDSVRKDFYDTYAQRLGSHATLRWTGMRAASSWSVPSHAAMLTGTLPHRTGLHAYNRNFNTLLPQHTIHNSDGLDEYRTVCVSANVYASSAFGFDTLFDRCIGVSPSRRFHRGIDVSAYIHDRDSESLLSFLRVAAKQKYPFQSVANGALLKLHSAASQLPVRSPFDFGARGVARAVVDELHGATDPTFVFANFMDAHGPHAPFHGLDQDLYDCAPSYTSLEFDDWDVNVASGLGSYERRVEQVRQLYAAEIVYLDRVIDDLIEQLQSSLDRNVRVVVTADHGENLGYPADGHLLNHTSSLSEALLHVPFDVVSDAHSGIVDGVATHLDLGTILNRLRTGAPVNDCVRKVVGAEIAGSGAGVPDDQASYWDRTQRVVYRGDRKYVRDEFGSQSVYDVSGPPSQGTRIDKSIPVGTFEEVFDDRIDEFSRRAERSAEDVPIDTTTEQRLSDLGYL